MTIKRDDAMLMVIDLQERLLPAMEGYEAIAKRSEILIKGLKELDLPMVITQQYTKGLGMSMPFVFAAAESKEYFDKTEFSAMKNETIIGKTSELGRKNVIVCGVEAHVCVLQTCIDLKERGFRPILVLDCIGSRERADVEVTIIRAQQEGITVTSSESILFELLERAGSETFKTISKLIR